jgi:hypothetical protein
MLKWEPKKSIATCRYLFIPRPQWRTSKLPGTGEESSSQKRTSRYHFHMKFLHFFLYLWIIFFLLVPDPLVPNFGNLSLSRPGVLCRRCGKLSVSRAGVLCLLTHSVREPVLRIRDILGWIRGSMPLTNESGSWSCYFCHWPSRCQQKVIFLTQFFLLITFWRYIYIIFQW